MESQVRRGEAPGGGSLPDATLQELVWRTAKVLERTLALENPETIIQHLAEPLEDGPCSIKINEFMDSIRDGLDYSTIPQNFLSGSMLLGLHVPLLKAVQQGLFRPHSNPRDAVLANQLLLHQKRTWEVAADLVDYYCDEDDGQSREMKGRLLALQKLLNGSHQGPNRASNEQ